MPSTAPSLPPNRSAAMTDALPSGGIAFAGLLEENNRPDDRRLLRRAIRRHESGDPEPDTPTLNPTMHASNRRSGRSPAPNPAWLVGAWPDGTGSIIFTAVKTGSNRAYTGYSAHALAEQL
jgi:hypothetical protein